MIDDVRVIKTAKGPEGTLRSLELRVGESKITTPARCVTSQELSMNHRHGLGVNVTNEVAVFAKNLFYLESMGLFASEHSERVFEAQLEEFNAHTDAPLCICSLQPSDPVAGRPNPILDSGADHVRLAKKLVGLQRKAGYDIVCVPNMGLNAGRRKSRHAPKVEPGGAEDNTTLDWLKSQLQVLHGEIESCGGQAMPSLDMGYCEFGQALEFMVDDLCSNVVNLIYRPPSAATPAYECLEKYADREVAFLVTDIPRANVGDGGPTVIHHMPFLGGDLLAPETRRGFGYAKRPNDVKRLQVLDTRDAALRPFSGDDDTIGTIVEELDTVKGDEVRLSLKRVLDAQGDNDAYDQINSTLRLHELQVSTPAMRGLASLIARGAPPKRLELRQDS